MKYLMWAIFFFLISNSAFCADHYKVGDTLFVWAKSGLNLRSDATTKSDILAKIPIGEELKIVALSDMRYNTELINTIDSNYVQVKSIRKIDPLILFGNWVKVQTESGLEGYVIDQYLLLLRPYLERGEYDSMLKLDLISIDTLYKNPKPSGGEGLNTVVKKKFNDRIKLIEKSGGVWREEKYVFEGYSIEEVLVFLSSSMYLDIKGHYILQKNWKNEIRLQDGGISIEIKKRDNIVEFRWYFSC